MGKVVVAMADGGEPEEGGGGCLAKEEGSRNPREEEEEGKRVDRNVWADGVFEGLGEMARGRGRDKGGEEGFIEFACGEPTLGPACGRSSCLDFPLVVVLWTPQGGP